MPFHEGRVKLFDTDTMTDSDNLGQSAGTPQLQPREMMCFHLSRQEAVTKDQYNFLAAMIMCASMRAPDPRSGLFEQVFIDNFVEDFIAVKHQDELRRFMQDPLGEGLRYPPADYLRASSDA